MVLQLFTNPREFMDRKVGQPNLRIEFLVILIIGVLGTLGNAYFGLEVITAPEEVRDTWRISAIAFALEPIFGIFVLWLYYSFSLHFIAERLFRARKPIRRILKLVAWALVPVAIGNVIRSIVLYVLVGDIEILSTVTEAETDDAVQAIVNEAMTDPVFLIGPVAIILTLPVTGYLLLHALQTAKEVSRDDAIKAVGVVVGIHTLFLLRDLANVVGTAF